MAIRHPRLWRGVAEWPAALVCPECGALIPHWAANDHFRWHQRLEADLVPSAASAPDAPVGDDVGPREATGSLSDADVVRIARATADAYSFPNYGQDEWESCCKMLAKRGYKEPEIIAILRSKWMRWASDDVSERPHDYGFATCADLENYLDGQQITQKDVDALLAGL